MYSLEQMIRQYNSFAKSYVMMKEEIEQQRELLGSDTEPELQLIFSLKPGYNRNRYNLMFETLPNRISRRNYNVA